MPYNPGITYQGGEYIARGISQGGGAFADAVKDGLRRYADENRLINMYQTELAGPPIPRSRRGDETANLPTTSGDMTLNLGTMEGPNEGTGEGDATGAMKKAAQLTKAMRTVNEHGYGYSRDQVEAMGLGQLMGLARHEERKIAQRKEAFELQRYADTYQHQQTQEELNQKQLQLAVNQDLRAASAAEKEQLRYDSPEAVLARTLSLDTRTEQLAGLRQTAMMQREAANRQALGNALLLRGQATPQMQAAGDFAQGAGSLDSRLGAYAPSSPRLFGTLSPTGAVDAPPPLHPYIEAMARAGAIAPSELPSLLRFGSAGAAGAGKTAFDPTGKTVTIPMPDGSVIHVPMVQTSAGADHPLSQFALTVGKDGSVTEKKTGGVTERDQFNLVAAGLRQDIAAAEKRLSLMENDKGKYPEDYAVAQGELRLLKAKRAKLEKGLSASAPPAGPAPTAAPAAVAPTGAMPQVGEVRRGYEYVGGDPSQPSSWRKK